MRLGQLVLFSTIVVALTLPSLAASRIHRGRVPSHGRVSSRKVVSKRAAKPKILGQRGIEDDRATQIQAALITAGYLTGAPSGHWDTESEAAMRKLQADHGWQTKLVPDSRALIKLGLGPGTSAVATLSNPLTPLAQDAH